MAPNHLPVDRTAWWKGVTANSAPPNTHDISVWFGICFFWLLYCSSIDENWSSHCGIIYEQWLQLPYTPITVRCQRRQILCQERQFMLHCPNTMRAHVVILKFELEDYDVRASPLGVGGKRCNEVSRGERRSCRQQGKCVLICDHPWFSLCQIKF